MYRVFGTQPYLKLSSARCPYSSAKFLMQITWTARYEFTNLCWPSQYTLVPSFDWLRDTDIMEPYPDLGFADALSAAGETTARRGICSCRLKHWTLSHWMLTTVSFSYKWQLTVRFPIVIVRLIPLFLHVHVGSPMARAKEYCKVSRAFVSDKN